MQINKFNWQEFIDSFSKSGKPVKSLARIRKLLGIFGNPHKKLKFIHIAGTNGKGSTLEYIGDVLQHSGLRIGRFTSPYITRYNDRIRINSQDIDDGSLSEICGLIAEKIDLNAGYSQFEITMTVAMIYFVRQECDIVLLETGIGGLLDCTNIIPPPLMTAITSISFDHMGILGESIEEITLHKAGIIKKGSIVFISIDIPQPAKRIIQRKAEECGCEVISLSKGDINKPNVSLNGNTFKYCGEDFSTKMGGRHQIYNAVTAIAMCRKLNIPNDIIKRAIADTEVCGRVQYVSGNPPMIIDGMHNIAGAQALKKSLKGYWPQDLILVIGMMKRDGYVDTARVIASVSNHIICVDGFAEGCVNAQTLRDEINGTTVMNYKDGVKYAKAVAMMSGGTVVVCGSLYLTSKIMG